MSTQALEFVEEKLLQEWGVSHSPSIGKLVDALAKAQLKFKAVVKHTDNAAFMRGGKASKYADLAEYIDATQAPLAENGLVVMQWPDVSPEAKSMSLVTILAHNSGEWMKGRLTLPATGRDGFTPQSCGSSITYARRYSYAAITGVASEDDDGNAASGRGTKEAAQAVAQAGIEKAAKAGNKTPQEALKAQTHVTTMFYVMPEKHNGNFAEFTNINAFLASNQDKEDFLRLAFTSHKAKKTKDETVLVPAEMLQGLLEELVGHCGVDVHKLQANQ